MKPRNTNTLTTCTHCGDSCTDSSITLEDKVFCCTGCKSVYQILNDYDLCNYYALNEHPGASQKNTIRKDKFAFLDDPAIAQKLIQFSSEEQTHVTFYLPQMHCSSCLWLLENIRRINPAIISSRVNFSQKEVFLTFDPTAASLREIVEMLTRIGYEPHLSLEDVTANQVRKTNKKSWYKIGLAGFCFANIMMLSIPDYFAGAQSVEPLIQQTFTLLILGLSIPVITYCSSEFFVNAWHGLKSKYLNIDVPIALALLITFGRSIYEIGTGTGTGYFDSLSGIVFFMLVGRILQDRTYQTISFDRDFKSFFPIAVNKVTDDTITSVPVNEIKPNDLIHIHHQELIPVDAILSKGSAEIDYSFVTGESLPVTIQKGEIIYAGGKQTGGLIELLVVKEVSQSYLTNLWNKNHFNKAEEKEKNSFIDLLSTNFTYIILAIAGLAGSYWYWQGETILMWNALTTILIVACPCALLLAANFTHGNMLRVLSKNKLYLKNAEVIETLSGIDTIVFDKTGTITENYKMKVTYSGQALSNIRKAQIASILKHSNHPLSKAVVTHLHVKEIPITHNFKVIEGKGIEAWIDDHHFKLGSPSFIGIDGSKDGSSVCVSIDGDHIGSFQISNAYRFGINKLFDSLKARFRLALISGDNAGERKTLEEKMGTESTLLFNQTPHEKLAYIDYLKENVKAKVLMVGDGLNDAGALKASDVGLAVSDDDNNFTPAADGIIHASKVSVLDHIMSYIRSGRNIILFSFGISILYNIVGLYFAVQGTLSPVIAAILMPASSISIILITYGLSQWMAKRNKL